MDDIDTRRQRTTMSFGIHHNTNALLQMAISALTSRAEKTAGDERPRATPKTSIQLVSSSPLSSPLSLATSHPHNVMKVPSFKHTAAMIVAAGSSPTGTSNAFDSAGNPFEHRVARAISACTRCRSRKSKVRWHVLSRDPNAFVGH